MSGPFEEFVVDLGTPFGDALVAARAAFDRRDIRQMDAQYRYAVRFAPAQPPNLRTAVAAEHVTRLRTVNDSTMALARCEEYLTVDANVWLRLLRAETDLVRGDHSRIDDDLAEIRRISDERPGRWVDALLSRLEGLAAAWHGRFSFALKRLRHARDGYLKLRDVEAVAVVDDDIRAVEVRQGTIAPDAPPQTRLIRSEELRLAGRYEEALRELRPVLDGPLDPALRYHFLDAKVRLLRLLRADDEADGLMSELEDAAEASAQPEENRAKTERLDPRLTAGLQAPVSPDLRLQHIRRLILDDRLEEAERLLLAERAPAEPSDRHAAEWHLAAGELMMEIVHHGGGSALAEQAVAHFGESDRHAAAGSLVAIRIPALRMLGNAREVLDEMDHAVEAWAAAHRLEERVARLQPTDRVRIQFLRGAPDEFDERIRVADRRIELGDKDAAAAVVVAMEAARGAAILSRILPGQDSLVRDLPRPSDIAGARRWVRQVARTLPRSQLVWMLHATPDHVHHAFIGRGMLRHVSAPCRRAGLIESIEALTACWSNSTLLENALTTTGQGSTRTKFDSSLTRVADLLGLGKLPELPGHVRRIALIAGGDLFDIPFAALPCPGSDATLIGRRYALSDLPCLSVRRPLARRSRRQRGTRGTRMLLLSPEKNLTPAAHVPGRTVLDPDRASPAALRDALVRGRYHQVRIDSHGSFGDDPSIQLAPRGSAGEMSPDELQSMDLGACGTLVLGACETGMATRIGRDERTGFVRAALLSGASAVLAARWEALDDVAARVLDRFEQHLRYHPRDVALFLAQRDEDTRDCRGDPRSDYPATAAHPIRWACWTLYGDSSYQTRWGPPRRWLFRRAAEREDARARAQI